MKKAIVTTKAPKAIGPYSQATTKQNMLFVSGQLPINNVTGEFTGDDIVSQTKQSLENIKVIIEKAGFVMSDVMKSTVYLSNMADFTGMNGVYEQYFEEPFPARAAFEVAKLPMDALVEIEVIALKG